MTEAEYKKLVESHGEELTKAFIEKLDNHKGANNKKYASDYRAILSWVIEAVTKKRGENYGGNGISGKNNAPNTGDSEQGFNFNPGGKYVPTSDEGFI